MSVLRKITYRLCIAWWAGMFIFAILFSFEIISLPMWILKYPELSAVGLFGTGIILAILSFSD